MPSLLTFTISIISLNLLVSCFCTVACVAIATESRELTSVGDRFIGGVCSLLTKVSIESALERLKKRKIASTSFEKEHEDFTKKIITGFNEMFKNRPNTVILDGEQPADNLANIAYNYIEQWITNNKLIIHNE